MTGVNVNVSRVAATKTEFLRALEHLIRNVRGTSFVCTIIALTVSFLVGCLAYGADQKSQRPFTVNDLFELEDVGRYYGGPYSFSADGQKLAFTRVRAKKTLANHKWEYLWGNAGGDVWVQMGANDAPVNITNGAKDGSGWWSPQWSADGRKLAMLSTRGGNVRLWVWDADTKQLRQLTTRGVDLVADVHERPFLWVNAAHLLCPVLPEGEQPLGMEIELQTPKIASAAWPKVAKGDEVTASVLESGVPVDLEKQTKGNLLLIDAASGQEKVVVRGTPRSWQLSPDGNTLVFTRRVSMYTPKANEPIPFSSSAFFGLVTVELANLDGTPIPLHGKVSQDVVEESIRWSPDGKEVSFLGYASGHDKPPLLYRLNVSQRTVTQQSLNNLDAVPIVREEAGIEWTTAGDLIVRAAKYTAAERSDVTARRDWWLIPKDGAQKCLTQGIKDPPRELWPQDGRQAFVGLADGAIWRLEPDTGKAEKVTTNFEAKIARISWPAMTNEGTDEYRQPGRTYSQLVFSVEESASLSPYLLDLRSNKITPIEKPAPKAEFVAYSPLTDTDIFYATDRNGLQIWRGDVRSNQQSALVSANVFLRDVAEGEFKQIEYTSLNGEKLKGWLILPPGYEAGKRYPVLAWVYAGWVAGDRPSPYESIDSNGTLNLQIPAARGYVVLLPSMPLAPEGVPEDPMLRLPEGVLPAVDKVIEMGIGDPDRLFLMGQSFGGFSTYGLVTQTQRFKAAVSLAGLSDLISLYGQFDARERYTEHPQEELFMQALMESAQTGMGNPPWKDQGRYIRNSPIFYVDRVKTPLMIIQGDVDYVAMQQGEEFFISLYRQGKRAKFVRYWGEGHVLESPANIRDMWNQIFLWFDEFSHPAPPGEPRGES